MAVQSLQVIGSSGVRESLASKLKTARSLTGMSTRAVAAKIIPRFPISHATIANGRNRSSGNRVTPEFPVFSGIS